MRLTFFTLKFIKLNNIIIIKIEEKIKLFKKKKFPKFDK